MPRGVSFNPRRKAIGVEVSPLWYVRRGNGEKRGPFTAEQLRTAARQKKLLSTDLVRKEGLTDWVPAGRMNGLFSAAGAASTVPTAPPPDSQPRSLTHSASVLGKAVKAAGDMALRKAEKTKLQTIDLPQAYESLGKAVYDLGSKHPDTAMVFSLIGDLLKRLSALKASASAPSEKNLFADLAISLKKQAAAAIDATSINSALRQQYVHLGTLTYQRADLPNHDHAKTAQVRELLDRDEQLSREISTLVDHVGSQTAGVQRFAAGAVRQSYPVLFTALAIVSFPFAPVSLLPIWKHPRWTKLTKCVFAICSISCTVALFTFVQLKTASVVKAVAAANATWDDGSHREAIRQYRALLTDSHFLRREEQARLFRRLIEYDASHDDEESARALIANADSRGLKLSLASAQAVELRLEFLRTPSKRRFDSSTMDQLYRDAKTLRLGAKEVDVLEMFGRPTKVDYTDPGAFMTPETIQVIRAAGGTPDTTPFRIFTWSSATDPENCFVMVCIKRGQVVGADCNEGKNNHTFHID